MSAANEESSREAATLSEGLEDRRKEKPPSRHEHEAGAPLTDDCDNWCRAKYEHWQKSSNAKSQATDAALSRQVAVPPAPTFGERND